ncbi:hypothetical protein [Kitasatospora albolonga]|uniref:hypothetical protein n=1 Tax=Kitasatospora albolonga TaxID=68173 RepID=UPI0031EA3083
MPDSTSAATAGGGQRADRGELHGDPERVDQPGTEQSGVAGDRDLAGRAAERLERARRGLATPGEELHRGEGAGDHHDQRLEQHHAQHQGDQHPTAPVQRQPQQR